MVLRRNNRISTCPQTLCHFQSPALAVPLDVRKKKPIHLLQTSSPDENITMAATTCTLLAYLPKALLLLSALSSKN